MLPQLAGLLIVLPIKLLTEVLVPAMPAIAKDRLNERFLWYLSLLS
jgi:hypothetical protein